MRIGASCSIGLLMVLMMAGSASAQGDHRIHVNFGGGPTFVFGEFGDRFSTGWGPAIGVTVETPSKKLGLQFEYAYRWMGLSDKVSFPASGRAMSAEELSAEVLKSLRAGGAFAVEHIYDY